ncbi:uncharacterized protein LOC108427481 [Pygocentrus nattereri]|uniref:uncharacterized protein LOC108427481 n=1 Tax=Pygocentrus nattereri TaxID=42514 RepID=UPI000814412C|nr:uncharacterized protein LOC108427481 [Pygocentrus nattereri]
MGNNSLSIFQKIFQYFSFRFKHRNELLLEYNHLLKGPWFLLKSAKQEKNISRLLENQLEITDDWSICVKARGRYGSYQFINTCVLDSLLVGLFICHIKFENIHLLLQSDLTLNTIMTYLYAKKHDQAKALWLIHLKLFDDHCKFKMSATVDVWSEVKDHLPMLRKLVCSKDHAEHESIYREFQRYGDVMILAETNGDPSLILVHTDGMNTAPPFNVKDGTFELQFLLLWKKMAGKHMVVCNKLVDRWFLHDSDELSDRNFSIDCANFRRDYSVYLAAYVKIPPGHKRVGIPVAEEGSRPDHGESAWHWTDV